MKFLNDTEVATIIGQCTQCIITSHVNPDGDACGSSLALLHLLQANGIAVRIIYTSEVPTNMRWLPLSDKIEYYQPQLHDEAIENTELLICVDFNSASRVMRMQDIITSRQKASIVVDHHEQPQEFASFYWVETESSSTCEMVWRIAKLCTERYGFLLNKEFATSCYTGIMTDTGGFRFPRTDAELHRIVADLIDLGADPVSIYESVMNDTSYSRMLLLGRTLSGMEKLYKGQICVLTIHKKWFEETGATLDDTEGFVQYTLTISGISLGILFIEHPLEDVIKTSIRSKGSIEARILALQFGGGGHFHAAATRFPFATLESVKQKVLIAAENLFNNK